MTKFPAVVAASAAASAACAQSDGWLFEFDQAELSPASPTAWVTLSATFPAEDHAFAGARLSVNASEPGWGAIENLTTGPGTSTGIATGSDVTGIIVGQVYFPPAIMADPRNPLPVWRGEFTVTDFRLRDIDFWTATSDFRVYPDAGSPASRVGIPWRAVSPSGSTPPRAASRCSGLVVLWRPAGAGDPLSIDHVSAGTRESGAFRAEGEMP